MANPTTNYSFVMPTNTDLVKDLPADFEVFGQAVDTQMKTNADAAIAKTIVDAKGDIIAATAADTVSRLAVGANDTVLTADSSTATGLKWATPSGSTTSFTLLNSGGTALTGATTVTVNITAYDKLYIFVDGASSATGSAIIGFRFNSDTGSNYIGTNLYYSYTDEVRSLAGTYSSLNLGRMTLDNTTTITGSIFVNAAKSTGYKIVNWAAGVSAMGGSSYATWGYGHYIGSSTITSVSIISSTGNLDAGTVYIYGAN